MSKPCWGHLATSLAISWDFRALMERLWSNLGPFWPNLPRLGILFGPTWSYLGLCEAILGCLEGYLGLLEAILGHLGRILGPRASKTRPGWLGQCPGFAVLTRF